MPTIDHDPNEPSHKVLKLAAVLAAVLTLALMVPVTLGIKWTVYQLPIELVLWLSGLMFGVCGGFFFGRWEGRREFLPPNSGLEGADVSAAAKYATYLLVRAPLAIYLLPVRAWSKSKDDGDPPFARAAAVFTAAVIGFMISLGCLLVVLIPVQIAFGI